MSREIEELLRSIQRLRGELKKLAEFKSLSDNEVIALSNEIDELVIIYHNLKLHNPPNP